MAVQFSYVIPFPGTAHIRLSFPEAEILFVPAPQIFDQPSLVVPIVFGTPVTTVSPVVDEPGLVIPIVFGALSIDPGEPTDPEPPEPPTLPPGPPGQGSVIRQPRVGATEAHTPTSGAVPVRGVKVVG